MDKKKLYFIVLIIIIFCIEGQSIFILNRSQVFFRFIYQTFGQQSLKNLIYQYPLIYSTFQYNIFVTTSEMVLVVLAMVVLYYEKSESKFFVYFIPFLIIGILITGIMFLVCQPNYVKLIMSFAGNQSNCITMQCTLSPLFISIRNDFTLYLIANSLSLFFFEIFYIFRMKQANQLKQKPKNMQEKINLNQTQQDLVKRKKNKQLIGQDLSVENMSQVY